MSLSSTIERSSSSADSSLGMLHEAGHSQLAEPDFIERLPPHR